MDNNILTKSEIHAARNFIDGREFVNAVANAPSKEALKQILNDGGIHNFDDAQLDYCYKNLALSQNWDAVSSLFQDKDLDSCSSKLAEYGISTTREGFVLINDVIAVATNDALVHQIMTEPDHERAAALLAEHGYPHITADFLETLSLNAMHLRDDGILTEEDFKAMCGKNFWERCSKSINIVFAMSCITELILGLGADDCTVEGATEPAFLIAIASGISLL